MRSTSLSTLLIVSIVAFSLISCGGGASSSGGTDGTDGADGADGAGGVNTPITCRQDGFTVISDIDGLKAIGENTASMAKNYCLTANIDLASATGADSGFPLGWNSDVGSITAFTGNFDGQDNTITGLTVTKDTGSYIGLFAKISSTGTETNRIKDLTLDKFAITGLSHVGALAGQVEGTIIESVQVTTVTSEAKNGGYVGGLMGNMQPATVGGSTTTGSILTSSVAGTVTSAGANTGGLAGSLTGASVSQSHSDAVITAAGSDNVGGLVGSIDNSGNIASALLISKSYAIGDVSGGNSVGALVGSLKGKIVDSYAVGAATAATGEAGGLIGLMESGSIENTYAIGVVTASTDKGGLIGKLDNAADKCNDACTVTTSYFDKSTNTATNAIGNKGGATITPALHTGVNGKADIKGDGATPAVYRTVADYQDIIFGGWDEANWNFADGQWPILERQEALSAGTVNPAIVRDCADTSYTAVYDVISLKRIADNMDGDYCLTANIDLGGVTSGFPLGWTSNADITAFTGNFDGEGHIISNLVIDNRVDNYIGLFARIEPVTGKSSEIKDLTLNNFNITAQNKAGALVGEIKGKVTILRLRVNNVTLYGEDHIGGLVGEIREGEGSKISGSSVIGGIVNVIGNRVGGLIGSSDSSIILNSYATASITGNNGVGGLVGYIMEKGEVLNSYATGKVTGAVSGDKGGLIGQLNGCSTNDCIITNSYFDLDANRGINAIGAVDGTATTTGLVGVAGTVDIKGDGATPVVYKTVDGKVEIFDGWSVDDWKFADGQWPILEWQTETLSAGVVNQPIITNPICKKNPTYTAVQDVAGLKAIGDDSVSMAKNYCLTRSVDLGGVTSGFPLGWTSNADITAFTGNFDGEGHTISNLRISNDASNDIGLFSKIIPGTGKSSEIKNLTLNTFGLTGANSVGALAGLVDGSVTVSKVIAKNADINGVSADTGGLIGYIKNGVEIIGSNTVKGTINATNAENMDYQIGGLVGKADQSNISNSYSSGDVGTDNGNRYNVVSGGLVGLVKGDTTVSNSYATGAVKASKTAGGLVGFISGDGATVSRSYATGAVQAKTAGGLIGKIGKAIVSNSYATGAVKAKEAAGGLVGFIEKHGARVSNSYAIGAVSGEGSKGGLVGYLLYLIDGNNVTNSYYDKIVSNMYPIGRITASQLHLAEVLVNGKDDIVLKSDGKFYVKSTGKAADDSDDKQIFVGWDATIWQIMAGEWPTFKWQVITSN